jgi:hypothetical protein
MRRHRSQRFSDRVEDAIVSSLKPDAATKALRRDVLALKGSLSRAEGKRFRTLAAALRRFWRRS